jgi:hypothetical protein
MRLGMLALSVVFAGSLVFLVFVARNPESPESCEQIEHKNPIAAILYKTSCHDDYEADRVARIRFEVALGVVAAASFIGIGLLARRKSRKPSDVPVAIVRG